MRFPFGVFRVALGDETSRKKWLGQPAVFFPWVFVRAFHPEAAQKVMRFFSRWEVALPTRAKSRDDYDDFIVSFGVGLERYNSSTELDPDPTYTALDGEAIQLATLLAACGLYRRRDARCHRVYVRGVRSHHVLRRIL